MHDVLGESFSKVTDLINLFKCSFKRIDPDQRFSTVRWLITVGKYDVSHAFINCTSFFSLVCCLM